MYFRFSPHVAAAAAASAFLLAACAATPSDGPRTARTGQSAGVETEEGSNSRLECRMVEHTGSRLRKERVCMTAEEWRRVEREGF